jgi:uncharacterized membrane protein
MPVGKEVKSFHQNRVVNLARLEAVGDAVFAFALTLLALDLKLPESTTNLTLIQNIQSLLPKLLIFIVAFLLIAQQWDVHQRTMMNISHADGIFVWQYFLSLMFVVLMPASAGILGRFPLQPMALLFFGINTGLLCFTSWIMWNYASHKGKLLDAEINPDIVKMISNLWLYPPILIVITLPLGFLSVYPVYAIWVLMPIGSYAYSRWAFRKIKEPLRSKKI